MGIVGVVCVLASTAKTGVIMYSLRSNFKQARVKYVVKKEKLQQFYNAMAIALLLNIFVAVSLTRNLKSIVTFTVCNMLFIGYCLMYWIVLEPKPRK